MLSNVTYIYIYKYRLLYRLIIVSSLKFWSLFMFSFFIDNMHIFRKIFKIGRGRGEGQVQNKMMLWNYGKLNLNWGVR